MNARVKQHQAGDQVRVRSLLQYPLPAGLFEGQIVTIQEVKTGFRLVRDMNGNEFEVSMACIEAGLEYQVQSEWLPPSHPAVAKRLATGR